MKSIGMRTIPDVLKAVPQKWAAQYRRELEQKPNELYVNGLTYAETLLRLQSAKTVDAIDEILGNASWTIQHVYAPDKVTSQETEACLRRSGRWQ